MIAGPTVFLVDDDASVRRSLVRLLESHGRAVIAFPSAEDFLIRHDSRQHGCLVLDVSMPGLDGLALQRALESARIAVPIVFISGHGTIPATVQAMKAGAVDFLTKPISQDALLTAIDAALEKDRLARLSRAEIEEIEGRLMALTPREREVLTHVVAGKMNKQIAGDLSLSEITVKIHRGSAMRKMGAKTLQKAAMQHQRFDNEQHDHERGPNPEHGVHPPEARIFEAGP